ncbi:lipase 2 [Aspergillus fumigatus]
MVHVGAELNASAQVRFLRSLCSDALDPRLDDLGKVLRDEYAVIRDHYETPKYPVVLAHGLLGFDELRLAGPLLPGVQYWRGIKEALTQKGVQVITATVPPSGSIEMRAEELVKDIDEGAQGKAVNIIAGLDARYMISRLRPKKFKVLSLTTIATPHRGMLRPWNNPRLFTQTIQVLRLQIMSLSELVNQTHAYNTADERLPQLYYTLGKLKVETGAFSQLTRKYMEDTFNPATPDVEDVRYFSYGAAMQPSFWSMFRLSHRVLQEVEGYNDGLVSVASSKWGKYKGTLEGASHLDLINWTNRLKWLAGEITGNRQRFVKSISGFEVVH